MIFDMEKNFVLLLGMLVLCLGFTSAVTMECVNDSDCGDGEICSEGSCIVEEEEEEISISGIIYNTSIGGDVVEGANVEVICNGIPMTDVSESDGSYGVSFLKSECNSSHVYSVSAEKDDYFGESGEYNDINDLFGAVMNLAVEKEEVEEEEEISISGIIYNTSIGGDVVEGADVEVVCDGVMKSDVSRSDGAYGVSFLKSECNSSHVYSVSAEKDDYFGESGEYSDINDLFGAVMNLAVEKEEVEEEEEENKGGSFSSSGSGGKITMCADGYHFESVGSTICVPDVVVEELNVTPEDLNASEESGDEEEDEEDEGFFAWLLGVITGAVVGLRG
jgi:hypothetical protein